MAVKVGMVSLGCCKNQVDAEIMLHKLKKAGFTLCTDAGLCDVVIVNTCGFIGDAKAESIEQILEFVTLKNEGRIKAVVVTGCLAERYREELAEEIPEADVVLGIGSNDDIVKAVKKALDGHKVVSFGDKENLPLSGERIISNLPFYAYLKLADGCDNHCTYCAIPAIRGRFRSRELDDVMKEATHLVRHGVKELVLVAQDTTRYGEDLYGKSALPALLDRLQTLDGLKWVRMLYCYPDKITDDLLAAMKRNDKVVPYLDIPIQHIASPVLKRMNRRDNEESLRALLDKLHAEMPELVLRSTLIAGFPGETEEDFEKLCAFVQEGHFARLGCFAYSQEEGTPAALLPDQLDDEVKAHRAELIMDHQYAVAERYTQSQIGKTLEVVVEGFDKYAECFFGRSAADAPDIDPKVFFTSTIGHATGDFVRVLIEDTMEYDLVGTALTEE